ncbi:hypothetical protein MYSTI_01938 [Myxococcus stipitatus DSM 14675]|uniref:Uncharacterized protein n=1 Tax=Myxococcus stipitatus (strain DSM 14675 / JCM 12634 / Mx s8) TaxID=1278073 RepID=L7U9X8_MYXSD|nr:hypothetical protein MYSTI_01938 [Myxococcus stipitatus DSM 14675]
MEAPGIAWGGDRSPTGVARARLLTWQATRWTVDLDDGRVVDWPTDEPVHGTKEGAVEYARKRWRCDR